ncbi:MAG: hypothetical protein QM688_14395, partial [Sphingomonas bacterium]
RAGIAEDILERQRVRKVEFGVVERKEGLRDLAGGNAERGLADAARLLRQQIGLQQGRIGTRRIDREQDAAAAMLVDLLVADGGIVADRLGRVELQAEAQRNCSLR